MPGKDHIVVVLPNQNLNHKQQVQFTSAFGTPGTRSRDKERRPEGEEFDDNSYDGFKSQRLPGECVGFADEMWFHHDSCYYPKPDAATFLYALEIPSKGGNTRFQHV